MPLYSNLVEVVLDRAKRQPDDRAYVFLADGEVEEKVLTYAALEAHARAVAVRLSQSARPGDRALLLYAPGLEFVVAFLGCQLAGVIAVPVYPPRKPEEWPRFAAIAKDAGARVLCTQEAHAPLILAGLEATPELAGVEVIATDAIDLALGAGWTMPPLEPESLAFLQYTSGSTGVPKGVMVSHRNLLHNESIIQRGFGSGPDTVGVNWLPQYHDMGLIGSILQPLYLGGLSVLMSPLAFLQQPLRWLDAITKYRGTSSGGPNFAYELCVSRVTDAQLAKLDLSSWRIAFNGAEPVRLATLERFAAKFASCGFHRDAFFPCYGLAEATLYVTGKRGSAFPRALHVDAARLEQNALVPVPAGQEADAGTRALVGCGVAPEPSVRIVDPSTRLPCADGAVGEIWVYGASVARGYWNRPDATRETFDARIEGTGEGPFLRTGDLGVVHDGELFVTGRLKELIIVDGRNHYPQDIEETVQDGRPMLRKGCGAAFSIEHDGAERLVMVQEVVGGGAGTDLAALAAEVRAAVAERHGIALHALAFVPERSVKKTSSGKIRRRLMRERFLEGTLETIFAGAPEAHVAAASAPSTRDPSRSRSAMEKRIAALVASRAGLAPAEVDVDRPFSAYGLDSRALVGLSGELESLLGRKLEPQLFYNYATVSALARFLAGESEPHAKTEPPPAASAAGPIAIVGMACRFPGAPDLESFWDLLVSGRDAIREVPASRWDVQRWFDPDPSAPGKMATRWGGFIDHVDSFDADFFGISPREAEAMDPQQRLVLELAWHALEDARIRPESLKGSRTGVFVGISGSDYARLQAGTAGALSAHAGTGNALSIVANRLSYFFDLRGPSVAVDTACSSSLTALHQAALHLKAGDCDAALVSGINLLLAPDVTVGFSQNRMMAADGRCKTFGKDADGYVRSEGGGVVVLKRLADALAAGDRVWAVIAGSACNQDGRSNGLTAPNGLAQQAVVEEALAQARWRATDVQMVETHGTGTRLGDPIEAEALGAVYGQGRDASAPLVLGAVKSQIGHLEAAAGMAGIIKTALCLARGTIPANLHAAEANPLVRLEAWNLALPRAAQPWPAVKTRRAGVSAFGFGGTNAHALLEQPPAAISSERAAASRPLHVLALSAKSGAALDALVARHGASLAAASDDEVAAMCHAATAGRHHFREARRAVVGATGRELAAALTAPRDDERSALRKRGVAFLFTGQGAQYVEMGRRLYETHPLFRATLDRCDRALAGARAHGLLDLLYPPADQAAAMDAALATTAYTQPALYALEVALATLWMSWGVRPAAVMGHSLGEFSAAAVAGVFDLEEGLALVEARGRLMQALPEAGGMLAVFAHERDLEEILPRFAQRLSIGAFNGPGQMVLSGCVRELERARQMLKQRGIEAKPLKVSHAFHSPLMEPMMDDFRRVAETIRYREPSIPVVSNLTGRSETTRLASASYWVEHVRAPVRFAHGVEHLKGLDVGVLLEIGPRPVLAGMARRMLSAAEFSFHPSLDAGKDDWRVLGESVASLYELGIDLDWAAWDAPFGAPAAAASAPLYPFERKRFWFDPRAAGPLAASVSPTRTVAHSLLGRPIASPRRRKGERHFESEIHMPGPAFHRLPVDPPQRRVSLLAYLEMALQAQHEIFPENPRCVHDLRLEGLLQVHRDEPRTVQTICEPCGEGMHRMEVWTLDAGAEASAHGEDHWRKVAEARLCSERGRVDVPSLYGLRARIQEPIDVEAWYESTRESGLNYCTSPEPAIRRLWWAPSEVLAEVTPRDEDDVTSGDIWLRHSLWNACNQVLGAIAPRDGRGTYFPVSLDSIRFLETPGRALVMHARLRERGNEPGICIDVNVYAEDGAPVTVIEGMRLLPDEAAHTLRAEWRKTAEAARPALLAAAVGRIVARAFKRSAADLPHAQPLTALGLDSLTAMDIVTRVERELEIAVNLATLQQGASLEDLVRMLGEQLEEAEGLVRRPAAKDSPLVDLNRGDATLTPLFLVHPIGGSVFCYQELARHLGSQPLVAVQSPALSGSSQTFATLEALAAHYVTLIQARQPRGPYRLGGWSMGGVLAFEIARRLEASGEEVECLLLLDAMAAGTVPMRPARAYVLTLMARGLGIDLAGIDPADLEGDVDAALHLLLAEARAQGHALRSLTHADFRRLLAEYERNLALLAAYPGQPYHGTATVLRAETPLAPEHPQASGRDWEQWLAGVDALHTVPGDHFSLLSGSHLTLTASYVRKALKAAGRAGLEGSATNPRLELAYPRAPENVVIGAPVRGEDGRVRTTLVVDESHPFFFDHPLDHVSGILMLEGMLQLVEAADVTRDGFLRYARLTFPRFCEKDRPIELELTQSGEARFCRALQAGVPVCTLRFDTDRMGNAERTPPPSVRGVVRPAEASLLHKARASNVLIGEWRVEDGIARASLLEPPPGHLLAEGDPRHHSPLFALETVRQLTTGLAHTVYGVPQGMPMNLVGVELVLDAPLPRGVPLSLRHRLRPPPPASANTFAHFETEILAGGEPIGDCRMTAQLLTREAYLRVRHANHRARAA